MFEYLWCSVRIYNMLVYQNRHAKEMGKIFMENRRMNIMQLKRLRKKQIGRKISNTENVYEKTVIIERIKIIKEHITNKM